jgi:hypothetical protein
MISQHWFGWWEAYDNAHAQVIWHPLVSRLIFPCHVLGMMFALLIDFHKLEPTLAVQVEWGLHFE